MDLVEAASLAVDLCLPDTHRLSIHPNTSTRLTYPDMEEGDRLISRVRRGIGPVVQACYFEAWPTNPTPYP